MQSVVITHRAVNKSCHTGTLTRRIDAEALKNIKAHSHSPSHGHHRRRNRATPCTTGTLPCQPPKHDPPSPHQTATPAGSPANARPPNLCPRPQQPAPPKKPTQRRITHQTPNDRFFHPAPACHRSPVFPDRRHQTPSSVATNPHPPPLVIMGQCGTVRNPGKHRRHKASTHRERLTTEDYQDDCPAPARPQRHHQKPRQAPEAQGKYPPRTPMVAV